MTTYYVNYKGGSKTVCGLKAAKRLADAKCGTVRQMVLDGYRVIYTAPARASEASHA